MNSFSRSLTAAAALFTLLASSTAMAWAVPIHKCSVPSTPTPAGQDIPCDYTNADGQTFSGVVTVTSNGTVLCTGLVAPTGNDPLEAQSIEALFEKVGSDYWDAPYCAVEASAKGEEAVCYEPGYEPWNDDIQAAVQVCGDGWCLELMSYVDCNDYWASEPHMVGSVECNDVI